MYYLVACLLCGLILLFGYVSLVLFWNYLFWVFDCCVSFVIYCFVLFLFLFSRLLCVWFGVCLLLFAVV